MSFVDGSSGSKRKALTGAAVAVVQGALAVAIVNGLAVTFFETEKPRNLPSQFFPTAPVTPPVEPTREPEAQSVVPVTTPVIPKPRIDLVPELPQDGVIIDPLPTTALSEISREPATPAVATSEPASRFVAAKARPRGDVARWVTTEDYPTADVRAGNTGTVGFRLSIDVTGRVRDCSITRTSGHPGLDAATCRHVTRRARFEPATDTAGLRVTGVYDGSIRWVIPVD
jgi:protein TonB